MLIFAGLGNPGAEYAGNRHNIGYMAVDRIAADHGFGPWRPRFQGVAAEGWLGTQKVLLLKPETYMNRSGQSVGEAMRFFKLDPTALWVFHDELDLAPGKLRVKQVGGHAGPNGLRSIHAHLGEDYGRVRLGIGHPGRKDLVARYVLHDFAKDDRDWLDPLLDGLSRGAALLAQGDTAGFQNAVGLAMTPPREKKPRPGSESPTSGPKTVKPGRVTPPEPQPDRQAGSDTGADTGVGTGPGTAPDTGPDTGPDSGPRTALQRLVDRFK